ncbi:MAG: PaaI family thioesterase [Alphaproteobacteria bacterium]
MTVSELQTYLDKSPYYKRYAISLTEENGKLITELPFSDSLIGNPAIRAIHGGLVAMGLELGANLQANLDTGSKLTPLSQTSSFLRRTKDKPMFVSAEPLKSGRRFVVMSAVAWQENREKPVATAQLTFQV